jgi:hypothetical protein
MKEIFEAIVLHVKRKLFIVLQGYKIFIIPIDEKNEKYKKRKRINNLLYSFTL